MLPTLGITLGEYRNNFLDRGLFSCTTTIRSVDSPNSLLSSGWPTTAQALSVWNEAHNMEEQFNLQYPNWRDRARTLNHWPARSQWPAAIPERRTTWEGIQNLPIIHHAATLAASHTATRAASQDEPEQITDASDPRLREIWKRAAAVAAAEGYCPEYDRIAQQIGAPTREELNPPAPTPVLARFTVTLRVPAFTYTQDVDLPTDVPVPQDQVRQQVYMAAGTSHLRADIDVRNAESVQIIGVRRAAS